jgi:hypothetical protein
MNDVQRAEAVSKQIGIRVVDARTVKILQVGDFQTLLKQGINFRSLKPAVMINQTLLVGA